VLVLGLTVVAIPWAQAQTFTVLYYFTGSPDGEYPRAGLDLDSAGNLYGTTYYGGSSSAGTVFKVDTSGTERVLYSFAGRPRGRFPLAGVVRDHAGNLYGTTDYGGTSDNGVVFRVDPKGKEEVLHSFARRISDGSNPVAGLIMDAMGNLYGTTELGGSSIYGTVFKTTKAGKTTVLYSFTGGSDGGHPLAGLVRDKKGNLYGTTDIGGGQNDGTVYKLSPGGTLTVLHRFAGYPKDGSNPVAGLFMDAKGRVYGNTCWGGAHGWGTVFTVNTSGKEAVLYSFTGGSDGGCPNGGLIMDAKGNLYGNTCYGGGTGCSGGYGCGTVFRLDSKGAETVLHKFSGRDGQYPYGSLVRDAQGNLYGTASEDDKVGFGTVWKLTPSSP